MFGWNRPVHRLNRGGAQMGGRRIAALALSGALVAGGTGAAIAAVSKDERKAAEDAVLEDAAKRLNVTPDKLRDALAAAQNAQLDQAVKDGKLTQKQADVIKERRKQSGVVLGGPGALKLRGGGRLEVHPGGPGAVPVPGFGHGHGPHGPGLRMEILDGLADALGTTQSKLREGLRDGKSIADLAKANGKSLDDVRKALKATAKARLDKAVKDENLTQKQADRLLDRVGKKIDALTSGKALLRRGPRFFGGEKPPLPDMPKPRPGLLPGEGPPELAPPPDEIFG
jgi:hypothetical protein